MESCGHWEVRLEGRRIHEGTFLMCHFILEKLLSLGYSASMRPSSVPSQRSASSKPA